MDTGKISKKNADIEEFQARSMNGLIPIALDIIVALWAFVAMGYGFTQAPGANGLIDLRPWTFVPQIVIFILLSLALGAGLHTLKPNEAVVLTLFGKYAGTLWGPGLFFVNPFSNAISFGNLDSSSGKVNISTKSGGKKLSLKTMTLNNDKQKINDLLGNPIEVSVVVIWRIVNCAKAVFNVDNFPEYLSIQCDAVLRNIVKQFPYDITDSNDELLNQESLRGSSDELSERIRLEMQDKVMIAGLEIVEARITSLAYAAEIAAVMLQRQQASAVIDARQMLVEGAVGMVEMALARLSENNVVELDEERKAAMVSNLLVVLCAGKDTQPVVNTGSIY